LDVTTLTALGALLVGVGGLAGTVVAYLGKRGENAITVYGSLTDNLQEERDRLDRKVTELHKELAEQASLRATDQAEITRLRGIIIQLGGQP
jgi:shikimate 5-dehydrogenase